MGKVAAISAVFAFLLIQFVHAAVLDVTDSHHQSDIVSLLDGHITALPEHQHEDGDGSEHDLDLLHSMMHDHHHITSLNIGASLIAPIAHSEKFFVAFTDDHGRQLRPPVPPPLA